MMDYKESLAWLRGERSSCNYIPDDPDGYGLTTAVRTAQADAAMTQQAYWVVKAHKEGLVTDNRAFERMAADGLLFKFEAFLKKNAKPSTLAQWHNLTSEDQTILTAEFLKGEE